MTYMSKCIYDDFMYARFFLQIQQAVLFEAVQYYRRAIEIYRVRERVAKWVHLSI